MFEEKSASVWYMDGHNLKHSDKTIVKLNYKGLEIAVLKEELRYMVQQFLIKDSYGEYWALGSSIAIVNFKVFKNILDNPTKDEQKYCDYIVDKYKDKQFIKETFNLKIALRKSFNKCEVEYIRRYCPQIYEEAKVRQIMSERNLVFGNTYYDIIAYKKTVDNIKQELHSSSKKQNVKNKKGREAR